jgi:glutathione S-transferase
MRNARESELKQTLEEFAVNPASNFKTLIDNLQPLVQILENSKFVEGDKPGYADYVVVSHLQWIKVLNSKCHAKILENLSPKTREWSDNMEGLFGGFLKNYECAEPKNFTAEW